MDLDIFLEKEEVLKLIVEKLGKTPIDFCEQADQIERASQVRSGAGVLVPLFFGADPDAVSGDRPKLAEWRLILIKRSSLVAQAGDLSCPGGMLDRIDHFFKPFVAHRFPPVLGGKALRHARDRGIADFQKIALFLTNALRESWEEVHLSPFRVSFLGPLPCRNLVMFTKTIFPVVGLIERPDLLRPNHEVEKIVCVPLRDFFDRDNLAVFAIDDEDRPPDRRRFPCFVHRDEMGREEILWGATYSIVLNFLKIVFDYDVPPPKSEWVLKKKLRSNYLTGNRKSGART